MHKNHEMLVGHQSQTFAAGIDLGVKLLSALRINLIVRANMRLVEVKVVTFTTPQMTTISCGVWFPQFLLAGPM